MLVLHEKALSQCCEHALNSLPVNLFRSSRSLNRGERVPVEFAVFHSRHEVRRTELQPPTTIFPVESLTGPLIALKHLEQILQELAESLQPVAEGLSIAREFARTGEQKLLRALVKPQPRLHLVAHQTSSFFSSAALALSAALSRSSL